MEVRETDAECAEELRKDRQEHKGASQGVGERGTETAASYIADEQYDSIC